MTGIEMRRSMVVGFPMAIGLLSAACTPPGVDEQPAGAVTAVETDPPEPVHEPEPEAETEPEPAAEDPFAVPAEIDLAYIERVVNEIFAKDGELIQSVLERPLPAAFEDHDVDVLRALYDGEARVTRTLAVQNLLTYQEYRDVALPAGQYESARFEAIELGASGSECVTVFGWPDLSRSSRHPLPRGRNAAYVLVRRVDLDPLINPTGWQLWDNNVLTSGGDPIPQDAWSDLDFGTKLDTRCGLGEAP